LVSSVKAAGETNPGRPLRESDAAAPQTSYGISKREGEQALRDAARRMEFVVLRPPLVYGPGVGANFRALMRLIDSGMPLPFGAVRNRRSLIARANLVDAIMTALVVPRAAGGTFYVTDGPPFSTPALIRALAVALDRPARLFALPLGILTSFARFAGRAEAADSLLGSLEVDDSAFRDLTGWRPPLEQAAAFRDVADWYRATRNGTGESPVPNELH
jgi:nucleoside-diphosphate-sugar epimerase